MNNIPITNNSLEAYNRHLNNVSETQHPSIYSLVSELKKETEFSTFEIQIIKNRIENKSIKAINLCLILEEYGTIIGINYLRKVVCHNKFGLDF